MNHYENATNAEVYSIAKLDLNRLKENLDGSRSVSIKDKYFLKEASSHAHDSIANVAVIKFSVKKEKIDSWAYVWTYSMWLNKGITIIPKKNLIRNIGFDIYATNSLKEETKHLKSYSLNFNNKLKKPTKVIPLIQNDDYVFKNHFQGKDYLWPWIIFKIVKLGLYNPQIFVKKATKFFLN